MIKYIIYTQKACGYCNKAKELLAELNLKYEDCNPKVSNDLRALFV